MKKYLKFVGYVLFHLLFNEFTAFIAVMALLIGFIWCMVSYPVFGFFVLGFLGLCIFAGFVIQMWDEFQKHEKRREWELNQKFLRKQRALADEANRVKNGWKENV